ncbi:DUF2017 domain-containing protein [Thermobifida halotolerans]|uniref:DUF2017 domain-containing protein n=1 Tax=Thermobifida halotolerans TaxID=483545 RepID=A0A399G1V0_9ACTN|nr:DUF2017 domain-containing protein [Thermobifida halotolerans]UOE18104.1 DUF2017 domain-containing protein [Thermobifida halotolerans]
MTTGFHAAPHGGARIEIDRDEARLLRSMAELVLRIVEEPEQQDGLAALVGISESAARPKDPVLSRLLPDAYTDDPASAGDFRRYTENGLRRHKRENAQRVVAAIPAEGGAVTLDADDAQTWLKLLTDVRLSLGTRMGVETEEDVYAMRAAASRDDSLAAAAHIYEWLTHLQETLVQAVWQHRE